MPDQRTAGVATQGGCTGHPVQDSQVRTEFSTGSFHVVFIWLTMEFSSESGVENTVMSLHCHCDVTAVVTASSADGGNLVHC